MAALCATFIGLLLYVLDANEDLLRSAQLLSRQNEAVKNIVDSETGLRGYLLTGDEDYLAPRRRSLRDLPERLAVIGRMIEDHPDFVVPFEKGKSDYELWNAEAEKALRRRDRSAANLIHDADIRRKLMDSIRVDFLELRTLTEALRDRRAREVGHTTRLAVGAIAAILVLFGAVLALSGRRQLLNLSERYEEVLETQREQNAELERQAWLRAGQAKLGERLRGDLSVDEVCRRAVEFLSEYVGAKLGALFLVGENGFLDRAAGLALAKDAPTRFAAGEGLIGKAARSTEPTVLDDLPADYARLTSALGDARPTRVVLAPLIADGEARGVLELGFLGDPDARAEEFLKLCSESMAISIRSAAYRAKLQDLLHESQQLSEELQTQQEELRVSNEELSERTLSLQESSARLESQQQELEQTNEQLEEQAQQLEGQRQNLDDRNSALEAAGEALREKANQLEAASRYKSEFLANMSHELRTPLNSSLILAKLLQDNAEGNLTEEQVHFASTIYEAGNDLLALINDILDLSKVEAGKLELNPEKVPLAKVLQGLERFFRPMAEAKGLEFRVERDADLPTITTDRQRLDQILRNLLSNAVKFTGKGSVSISAERDGSDAVIVRVRDTGIGIDPAQHSLIFDAFHQADGTISRKFGGTGLGLSISRSLAELLGGEIAVESEKGAGSTFSIRLPIEFRSPSAEKPAAHVSPAPALAPMRPPERAKETVPIPSAERTFGFADDRAAVSPSQPRILLVVEDEPDFAKILLDLGRELDYRVILANNAADGYAFATEYLPSAIILDVKLPDGSGLSLLDRLKGNPKTRHIPVHGMSGNDYSREALHLGAVGFLTKPANRAELKETLKRLEEKSAQAVKRVLVVEDDARQRESIEKLIGEQGIEIRSVGTGGDALDALAKTTFDCMIMDLRLPDMSGFQLLEKMTESEDRGFPPVIVYTGHDLSRPEEDRLRRYSKSIIIKGARSPERLLDEVTLFLHQIESKMSPEHRKLLQNSRNREKAFEGRRILIVDDDVRNIFALTSALEHKGAKITVARNGLEAVRRVEESTAETPTDLILMDIMMPEMDGYEAIRRIRADERFAELPIIAVTAKAMRDDYEKCLAAGANDYLAKPVDLDRLISLMRVWLPRQVGRL